MSQTGDNFEYDIAFSFLAPDEGLAVRLADLLEGKLRTFVFPKAQENLAGRDGEEKFAEVFGRTARIAVILYRERWGTTPWTRIEQTAIRNRAFEKGYGFTLWIPLDRPAAIPDYVPKTRLYADIETYGEAGVAAVIKALATEQGAESTPETLAERTARAARAAAAEQRRAAFHGAGGGVQRARERATAIRDRIQEWASRPTPPFELESHKTGTMGIAIISKDDVRRRAVTLVVGWRQPITNSTDGSELDVQLYEGVPQLPGYVTFEEARPISRKKYYCDLSPADEVVWSTVRNGRAVLSEDQLVNTIVGDFMQVIIGA